MNSDWRAGRDTALFKLEHEKNPAVRAEAAEVLCDLGSEVSEASKLEFAPAVVRLLGDAQSEVRCGGLALISVREFTGSDAKAYWP